MRIDKRQALNPDFSMNGIGTDNNNNPTLLGQQEGVRQTGQDNTVQQQPNPAPVQQPAETAQTVTDATPAQNPMIVYSDKETTQNGTTNQSATTSVRTTTPDTTEVVQAGYKDYDTNIANPTEQAYAKYKQQADALYSLLNPYNPEPIKQSRDLAQLQALATAFNDLGKALGKDIGNSEGFGMVTVDKSNYDNLRKEALKYRDAYNQALQQKGIAEMNRQMQFLQQELANKNANIKGRYQAGQQAKKDFESKNYDQTKSRQTTTNGQSRTRTLIDPNSIEWKEHQEDRQLQKRLAQYKAAKQTVSDDKPFLINPYYGDFKATTKTGEMFRGSETISGLDPKYIRRYYSNCLADGLFSEYMGETDKKYHPADNIEDIYSELYALSVVAKSNKDLQKKLQKNFDKANLRSHFWSKFQS